MRSKKSGLGPGLVFLLLVFAAQPGWGFDAQGKYVSADLGMLSCPLPPLEGAQASQDALRHWFAGYLTAVNATMPDTYNIAGVDIDFIETYGAWVAWVRDYCRRHPAADVAGATAAWVIRRIPTRLTRMP